MMGLQRLIVKEYLMLTMQWMLHVEKYKLILFWEATYVCVCANTYYKKIKRKSIA